MPRRAEEFAQEPARSGLAARETVFGCGIHEGFIHNQPAAARSIAMHASNASRLNNFPLIGIDDI
jgi:hypothetical protein